jgi:phosphohistidine phosphatase
MLCYFLRHGPAEDAETWQGSDSSRPLTNAGTKRIALEAKAMAALELKLDAVITSPLVRARQTAEIVAKELDLDDALVEDDRIGPGFSPERLAGVLDDHRDADAIMVVGHEPSMSQTIGRIVGGAHIEFKKGGLACVELNSGSPLRGALAWLATPKVLTTGA